MIKKLKYLICYLFDHKYNESAFGCAAWDCIRCGRWGYGDSPIVGNEFHEKYYKIWWKLTNQVKIKYKALKWKYNCWIGKDDSDVPF